VPLARHGDAIAEAKQSTCEVMASKKKKNDELPTLVSQSVRSLTRADNNFSLYN
jgi:hypothetical protein